MSGHTVVMPGPGSEPRVTEEELRIQKIMKETPPDSHPLIYWYEVARKYQEALSRNNADLVEAQRKLQDLTFELENARHKADENSTFNLSQLILMAKVGAIDLDITIGITKGKGGTCNACEEN